MMKKLVVALLIILLAFVITGCGMKRKIEQKVSEKVVEKIVSDDDVKLNLDGEKITVQGKDGEKLSIGGFEWPDIDYLPKFKKGQIISASNDGLGNVMILFENVDQKDFENYREILKTDFPEEANEMQIEEYLLYEGKNAKGDLVAAQYFKEDKTFTIIGNRDGE